MELIKLENVIKNYENNNVLKGINFTIQKGEFIGIMGKSGSGKTTLLKIMSMMEPLTKGSLYYGKVNVDKINRKEAARIRREELGFVFQEFFLMESLNILENVMLPLYISKSANSSGKEKAKELMKKFGIQMLENKMPNEISGGEKQRVAICRALINDSQIIFADEPTGNLDSKSGQTVIDALESIHIEMGKTIIMVTHDPQMASHCERIVFLKDGEILGALGKKETVDDFYKEIIEKMVDL